MYVYITISSLLVNLQRQSSAFRKVAAPNYFIWFEQFLLPNGTVTDADVLQGDGVWHRPHILALYTRFKEHSIQNSDCYKMHTYT